MGRKRNRKRSWGSHVKDLLGRAPAVPGGNSRGVLAEATEESHLESIKDTTFRCDLGDVKGCPIAPKAVVMVSADLANSWICLARRFDTEWIGYLLGERDGDVFSVHDTYFLPQVAGAAHCDNVDTRGAIRKGTIGAIHSHVSMDTFFSQTDLDHANWPLEIVVNRKGSVLAATRVRLGCSKYEYVTPKLRVLSVESSERLELELPL